MASPIKGFSKLSRQEKIKVLQAQCKLAESSCKVFDEFIHPDKQHLFNDISENVISNYHLPFSIAPNFLINDQLYLVPMVIEESSVVAAASKAAGFWALNGGFKTKVINTIKHGQVYFNWQGELNLLKSYEEAIFKLINDATDDISANMRNRGGGILGFEFLSVKNMAHTYQLLLKFNTVDSMGANFINSCLEAIAPELINFINHTDELAVAERATVAIAILSNYTPDCLVECTVSCPIEALKSYAADYTPEEFAKRFKTAVDIATNDTYRAVTHNKGIFNGIDAVVLATGNDFRAIEAGAQAYASRNGFYSSLTKIKLTEKCFEYTLTIPLAMGTVGGLTQTHPMAKAAMDILKHPSAEELMQVSAAAGMANNFSAVASLVTSGIQKGHMKLHLSNVLNALSASEEEKLVAIKHFEGTVVSYSLVEKFLNTYRD